MEKTRALNWQVREFKTDFKARADENGNRIIEGYFAVFNSIYDMGWGMSESIAPGAFTNTLSGDIRALVNHNTDLVLGRTTARSLTLTQDERGLWGSILINPEDTDAMNLYARVQRGDVSQCSFGFDIVSEETDYREDGTIHWTITEVKLYEVSCCTFPAYTETAISARKHDLEEIRRKKHEAWKLRVSAKLKGDAESAQASFSQCADAQRSNQEKE